jgi:UDP-N-acetylglucosamine--N-acetylmuramyl-(pentapeptide) pyrophosphoryl-undecaprenol N-acetylglucosamine transferase
MKNIIICAAKTGGHIFPALGFAKEALKNDYKITFLGTNTNLEKKIFARNKNIEFIKFELDGFRGKSITQKLIFLTKLPLIFFQVISIIISRKISSVVCFGGFITVPVGFASIISLRKLYLHEQNSVEGSSNRLLSFFAKKMFTAFPISKNKKYFFIGNPANTQNKKGIDIHQDHNLNILVTGGSQGADFINKNIPIALNTLNIKLNVIHQCGLGKVQNVSNYNQEINASIFEFIDNLDEYINWCDFAICRCGAGTLSEISQKKRGMIMIPLPKSIDNHQYFNALFYEKNNQGKIFQEKDSIDRLSNLLKSIIDENIYEDWKEKEPPIDHSRAASLMLSEIHKDNAAI